MNDKKLSDVLELLLQCYELFPEARAHCSRYITYQELVEIQDECKDMIVDKIQASV